MRSIKSQLFVAIVVACCGASVALACGFDFPWQLLTNRAATLDTMPINNSFAFAAAHVAPSTRDHLVTVEPEYSTGEGPDVQLSNVEVQGLSSDEADGVHRMRAENNGDSAFAQGAILPAAIRLYTAGAVDFNNKNSAHAIKRFRAVLDLPKSERLDREVWAAYMLGRIYSAKGEVARASEFFALTRALANNGAPDLLGLGVASYGEQARLHFQRAQALEKAKNVTPEQRRKYGREIAAAVKLYADQAAHGSMIAVDSLRQVANDALSDKYTIAASICDPMVQRLVIGWLITSDLPPEENAYGTPDSTISQVVAPIQKCGVSDLADAEQLAALAYRSGDYAFAERLTKNSTTPLAEWLKARLAMQKGDVVEAAKFYATAAKAFPSSGDAQASDEAAKVLLVGQNSVLTLSRGEYVDALEQLYPYSATYWGDVAYIAERVLTVDELKTFVDTHKDTQMRPPNSLENLPVSGGGDWFFAGEDKDPADHLRSLLARRLVRAGRYQEALAYVPSPPSVARASIASSPSVSVSRSSASTTLNDEGILIKVSHHHRHGPRQKPMPEGGIPGYVQALNDAKMAKSNVGRARGWYRAATLAGDFRSGSQIMGTEGAPDYLTNGGSFTGGVGQYGLPYNPFITEGERQRFEASAAKPDFRYHYIFVGVDEALHAAKLLPPRSQAFAAVMCNATDWMMDGKLCPGRSSDLRASPIAYASNTPDIADPIAADTRWPDEDVARINLACELYQRYLKEGPVVPWATHFGRDCPDPDFETAVDFTQRQTAREAERRERTIRHRGTVAAKLALLLAALAISTQWFVRHRYA